MYKADKNADRYIQGTEPVRPVHFRKADNYGRRSTDREDRWISAMLWTLGTCLVVLSLSTWWFVVTLAAIVL